MNSIQLVLLQRALPKYQTNQNALVIYFYIFIIVEKKVPNWDLLSFWVRMSALLELRYTLKLIRLNSLNSCGLRSIAIPKYSYVGNERTLKDRRKLGLSQIC